MMFPPFRRLPQAKLTFRKRLPGPQTMLFSGGEALPLPCTGRAAILVLLHAPRTSFVSGPGLRHIFGARSKVTSCFLKMSIVFIFVILSILVCQFLSFVFKYLERAAVAPLSAFCGPHPGFSVLETQVDQAERVIRSTSRRGNRGFTGGKREMRDEVDEA